MTSTQGGSALPLVSCIMPTSGRPHFAAQAIAQFQAQDYPKRELIILDDGDAPIGGLMPGSHRIRYYHLNGKQSIGEKRNLACGLARGSLVVHWDDDDWRAPWCLSYLVEHMLASGAQMSGLNQLYFYKPSEDKAWQYVYPDKSGSWLAGGSLCYQRSLWERHPFEDRNIGEDSLFVRHPSVRMVLPNHDYYVAIIHPGNTSPKLCSGPWWQPVDTQQIHTLLGEASFFYSQQHYLAEPLGHTRVKRRSLSVGTGTSPPATLLNPLGWQAPTSIGKIHP